MEKAIHLITGLLLITVGVLWALNTIGVTDVKIFFKGWWTIFIFLPCIAAFLAKPGFGPVIGIAIGVFLLLLAQGVIDWSIFWKICLAVLVTAAGASIAISAFRPTFHANKVEVSASPQDVRDIKVAFGEQNFNFDDEVFNGADIELSFGAATLDISKAVIRQDVVIRADVKFGGVTLRVPKDVRVEVRSKSAFGGVNNRTVPTSTAGPTILIEAECSFAGVEIRN